MNTISFQLPAWYIIICIFGAVALSFLLYYRAKSFRGKPARIRLALSFLRFMSLALLSLLLLGPMIKSIREDAKNPIVAVLFDNSSSLNHLSNDPSQKNVLSELKGLSASLGNGQKLDFYGFDEEIKSTDPDSLNYSGKLSNISHALRYISDVYEGDNLAALILASDGIYNEGTNPIYEDLKINCPLITLALGDSIRQKDVLIRNVRNNEVAYLKDEMQTYVDLAAYNSSSQRLNLVVEKESNGQFNLIHTEFIDTESEDFFKTVGVRLSLNEPGMNHFRYRISSLPNESNYANNAKDIYIDVLDARMNISIFADSPHPDVAAIKQVLEKNINYEVKVFLRNPSNEEIQNTNLAILHNLPSVNGGFAGLIQKLDAQKIPRLFLLGDGVDYGQFNKIQNFVTIAASPGNTTEAQVNVNTGFQSFTITDDLLKAIVRWPPVHAPFGEYIQKANVQTLLSQSIGGINTDFPLLSFGESNGVKIGFLFGTGIWQWKLFDYLERQNFNLLSELLDKSVVYTTTKEDKRKFRVRSRDNIYNENEDIFFTAELYNDSYELVNEPDVNLVIRSSAQEDFPFSFSKTARAYQLEAGKLEPGNYSYTAETIFNGEKLVETGKFQVRELQLEMYDLTARHDILRSLSHKYGGRMFYPSQAAEINSYIQNIQGLKPVIYQSSVNHLVLDLKWILLLIAGILVTEWFIRRYNGSL